MPKKESPVEIYLHLFSRVPPKDIIAMGYSRITVYKYSMKFPKVLEKFNRKKAGD